MPSTKSAPIQPQGPLKGVRVVDLTAMVMGPYCTQILADMGADVIKVEAPEGDNTRNISVGPAPGMAGVFVNVNRGKRSIVLDLRTDTDKRTLQALINTADVFIHSMRAKAIAKLGFSYQEVAALKPDIVYTNCYGYGRRGCDKDLTAYDDTIQAECGLPAIQQMLTGEPNFVGSIIADKVSGMTAVYATMMALFHRERTGEGQEVEVSMFETMAAFMLVEHANGAMFDPPLGPAIYPRAVARNRKPYRTRDGYIAALDRVYGLLAETFSERTTQEWLDLLRSLDIPAAPLRTPQDLLNNPHLNSAGFFETVETQHGPVRFPGVPTWLSRTPGHVAGPTPELGAHTEEILRELNSQTSLEKSADA
jgi:crotonobetainyl-CoA:carnitine CoA-transferase CaiB-like acyl-CoA transferase